MSDSGRSRQSALVLVTDRQPSDGARTMWPAFRQLLQLDDFCATAAWPVCTVGISTGQRLCRFQARHHWHHRPSPPPRLRKVEHPGEHRAPRQYGDPGDGPLHRRRYPEAIDLEPTGRLGKPEEMAEAVLWMSFELGAFVTRAIDLGRRWRVALIGAAGARDRMKTPATAGGDLRWHCGPHLCRTLERDVFEPPF